MWRTGKRRKWGRKKRICLRLQDKVFHASSHHGIQSHLYMYAVNTNETSTLQPLIRESTFIKMSRSKENYSLPNGVLC